MIEKRINLGWSSGWARIIIKFGQKIIVRHL